MNSWYTVKVKFTKEFQDGTLKRVTEPYLVNALSFTEAEARIYAEVGEFIRGEFIVTAMAKTDFCDIFQYDDADTWYKAVLVYITEDADSGKEKKVRNAFLVSANNLKEAEERLQKEMSGQLSQFEITEVKKTDIVEIFPFEDDDTTKKKAKKKADAKSKTTKMKA